MKKWIRVLGTIAVALLIGGGAFYGGMVFERTNRSNVQAQFFADRGGMMPGGGQMPGGFGGDGMPGGRPAAGGEVMARGTFGTIESFDGDTLVLSSGGQSTTVQLTGETTIQLQVSGDRDELVPGQTVSVAGERDDQGRLTAFSVQILPEASLGSP